MRRKKTKEEIIAGFKEVHGDRYDYSRVDYKSSHKKVAIICKEHGLFEQSPTNHQKGQGCPDCGGRFRYDSDKIIAKFQEMHGDRYDYSLVKYVDAHTKVKIVCRDHGVFGQSPAAHAKGRKCPDCSGVPRYDNDKIIAKFKEVHGDKYDYSLVKYILSNLKVIILCKEHGEFKQVVSSHLGGHGCPDCSGVPRYDNDKIIAKFQEIHSDKYDYSLVEYIDAKTKI